MRRVDVNNKKDKLMKQLSRREFLREAGSIIGGAALTSALLLSACRESGGTRNTNGITPTSSDVFFSPDTIVIIHLLK